MNKKQIIIYGTLILLIFFGLFTKFINRPDTFYIDTDNLGVVKADIYSFDNAFQRWSYDLWHSFSITFNPVQPLPGKTMTVTIDWFIAPTLMIPKQSYFILQQDFGNKVTIVNKDFGINWATYVLRHSLIDGETGKVEFTFNAPTKAGRYHSWYKIVGPNWKDMSGEFKYFSIAESDTTCPEAYFTGWSTSRETSSEVVKFRILHSWDKYSDGSCKKVTRTDYKTICKDGYHLEGYSETHVTRTGDVTCIENAKQDSNSSGSGKEDSIFCYICDGDEVVSQEFEDLSSCPTGYSESIPSFCGNVNNLNITCYGCNGNQSVSIQSYEGVCPKDYSKSKIDCSNENQDDASFFEKYKWYLLSGFALFIILFSMNQLPTTVFSSLGGKRGGAN